MSTPEGKIKTLVKRRMAYEFPRAYRFAPVLNGMGAPGLDVYYCIGGLFVAIETKALGKRPTPRQQITIDAIRDADGLAYVVDDVVTCELMIAHLKSHL